MYTVRVDDVEVEIGSRGFADTKVKINGQEVRGITYVNVEISAETRFRPVVTLKFGRRAHFDLASKSLVEMSLTPSADQEPREEEARDHPA